MINEKKINHTETTRQQGVNTRERILEAIKTYITAHGYPPTVREICDMTEIRSTCTVHYQMQRMVEDGTLETDTADGSSRAIRIPGMRIVFGEEDNEQNKN